MSNLMTTFEKLQEFIERDKTVKRHQDKLNKDIGEWISSDLGFKDQPATLCEIVKTALEKNYDSKATTTADDTPTAPV